MQSHGLLLVCLILNGVTWFTPNALVLSIATLLFWALFIADLIGPHKLGRAARRQRTELKQAKRELMERIHKLSPGDVSLFYNNATRATLSIAVRWSWIRGRYYYLDITTIDESEMWLNEPALLNSHSYLLSTRWTLVMKYIDTSILDETSDEEQSCVSDTSDELTQQSFMTRVKQAWKLSKMPEFLLYADLADLAAIRTLLFDEWHNFESVPPDTIE
jgi:hypothetical protein